MPSSKLFDLTRVGGFVGFAFVVGEDVAADAPAADVFDACQNALKKQVFFFSEIKSDGKKQTAAARKPRVKAIEVVSTFLPSAFALATISANVACK